jgi:hypothetical protein
MTTTMTKRKIPDAAKKYGGESFRQSTTVGGKDKDAL